MDKEDTDAKDHLNKEQSDESKQAVKNEHKVDTSAKLDTVSDKNKSTGTGDASSSNKHVDDSQIRTEKGSKCVAVAPKPAGYTLEDFIKLDSSDQCESKKKPANNNNSNESKAEKSHTNSLWIYNISKATKATDLKSRLSKFGKVVSAKIVTDGENCYGYTILSSPDDVKRCIANIDNTYFVGRKIKLSNKRPEKSARPHRRDSSRASLTRKVESKPKPGRDYSKDKKKRRMSVDYCKSPPIVHRSRPVTKYRPKLEPTRRNLREPSREADKPKRISRPRKREDSRERSEKRRRSLERLQEAERRRDLEVKLIDARKLLDQEKLMLEKERMELLKLQKVVADYERIDVKNRTDIIKKEARELHANLLKCKTDDSSNQQPRYYQLPPSPPRKVVRYQQEKKMHVSPPPPPSICKDSGAHKLTKKRFEEPKPEFRSYSRYNQCANGKPEHFKQHPHSNTSFNKYQVNKKPNAETACYNSNNNNTCSNNKNLPWKQISHHVHESYQPDYWKNNAQTDNQRCQRQSGPVSANFSSSLYHHQEYSRYGYHQDAGRKY